MTYVSTKHFLLGAYPAQAMLDMEPSLLLVQEASISSSRSSVLSSPAAPVHPVQEIIPLFMALSEMAVAILCMWATPTALLW